MSFWDKALGPSQPARPAVTPWGVQQPQAPAQWQHTPYTQQSAQWQQTQQPAPPAPDALDGLPPEFRGLAIQPSKSRADQEAGYIAATKGYIQKPPGWAQTQPTDTCPECGGVNFFWHGEGEGQQGRQRRDPRATATSPTYQYGSCFDCGYRYNGPAMSAGQEGNAHMHGLATGAVQQARTPGWMKSQNFFEIKERRR